MTDKSCRLSRSLRPRKGRRRSLRAGSGGAAQHNGAPLHDRSLARAFVHLLPSFRPSICHPDSHVVYVSARISAKSNLSLLLKPPTNESFATRDESCCGLLCPIVSGVVPHPFQFPLSMRSISGFVKATEGDATTTTKCDGDQAKRAGDQHFLVAGSSRRRAGRI